MDRNTGDEEAGGVMEAGTADAAEQFDPLRPRLVRVAYRMLGSVADAEDIVQEAFIRWLRTDRPAVREPEAFLRRVVTRLCLDLLKSARHQRVSPARGTSSAGAAARGGVMDEGRPWGARRGDVDTREDYPVSSRSPLR